MNKQLITEIYKELTGKQATQTNCRQCWKDYVIEINTIMAKKKKAGEDVTKLAKKIVEAVTEKPNKTAFIGARGYELHPVYSIFVAGKVYNSRNLTQKAAEDYLQGGGNPHLFANIPKKSIDNQVVTEVKEVPEITEKDTEPKNTVTN